MELDVRNILYSWLHRVPYYGSWDESKPLWNDGSHQLMYDGAEERCVAWLDVDLCLHRIYGRLQEKLVTYLAGNWEKPVSEWTQLPIDLHLELVRVFQVLGDDYDKE